MLTDVPIGLSKEAIPWLRGTLLGMSRLFSSKQNTNIMTNIKCRIRRRSAVAYLPRIYENKSLIL